MPPKIETPGAPVARPGADRFEQRSDPKLRQLQKRSNAEKPECLREAQDAISHLTRVLAKKKKIAPESFRKQLRGLLGHWIYMRVGGHKIIYPGMPKMAKWAEVCERQARHNVRRLELYHIAIPVGFQGGGRERATEYVISFLALKRWLQVSGYDPHPELVRKLKSLERYDVIEPPSPFLTPAKNPEVKSTKNPEVEDSLNPEKNPEATSARLKTPIASDGSTSAEVPKKRSPPVDRNDE